MTARPNAAVTAYHREQLTTDAAAIRTVADKLEALLIELRLEARLASDAATGEAMERLANELRDAAHTPFSALLAAHDAAADEAGMQPGYVPDAGVCLALGLKIEAPQSKAQLQRAMDEVAARFRRVLQ